MLYLKSESSPTIFHLSFPFLTVNCRNFKIFAYTQLSHWGGQWLAAFTTSFRNWHGLKRHSPNACSAESCQPKRRRENLLHFTLFHSFERQSQEFGIEGIKSSRSLTRIIEEPGRPFSSSRSCGWVKSFSDPLDYFSPVVKMLVRQMTPNVKTQVNRWYPLFSTISTKCGAGWKSWST